jgi:hypothetical protein
MQKDTLISTDSPMQNVGLSTTFVEQPADHSRSTEFPLSNFTDTNFPSSNFTLPPFLSEETAVEYEGVASFNSTLPELLDTDTAIYIYTAFILGSVFVTTIRSIFFFKVCMTASKVLHDTMFGCILAATMRFFDTNPSGKSIMFMNFYMVYIYILVLLFFLWSLIYK